MKTHREIVGELTEILNKEFVFYEEGYYHTFILSGFYKDDLSDYYIITFIETDDGHKSIEVSSNTDNPIKFVDMIKNIDSEAKIKYHEKQIKYIEKTA